MSLSMDQSQRVYKVFLFFFVYREVENGQERAGREPDSILPVQGLQDQQD